MKLLFKLFFLSLILPITALGLFFYLQPQPAPVSAQSAPSNTDWYMAGANPQRTSWVDSTAENQTEIPGILRVKWFKVFEPYILPRVQIITTNNLLYISTANGLYALDSATGEEVWVYPTSMPLGHSPAVVNGVAYVGGYDHYLHAINASSGQGLWKFEAEQGFSTSPLVVNNKIYIGNRDGYMYCLGADNTSQQGQVIWRYQTQGPINFSSAYDSSNNLIYFASDDSYAYALNADTGSLVWKSDKLPGVGFHSWWPVVDKDWVVLAAAQNYNGPERHISPGDLTLALEHEDIYPTNDNYCRGELVGPLGQEAGDWITGTPTIDMSQPSQTLDGTYTTAVTEYFEEPTEEEQVNDPTGELRNVHKPWRRTMLVLNKTNGQEYTTDLDNDGRREYAPILYFGTHGGNRYPSLVGSDGVIYQTNNYMGSPWIDGGHVSGWKVGSPFISVLSSDWGAVDEPHAYSAGGNLIYWNLLADRQAGSYNISLPYTKFLDRYCNVTYNNFIQASDYLREWLYWSYNLDSLIPGYNVKISSTQGRPAFGNYNGIYGYHGDQNPLIPYKGRVYTHRSNAIICLSPDGTNGDVGLPEALIQKSDINPTAASKEKLKSKLENEVQKIIQAGHLRPGWDTPGLWYHTAMYDCGDFMDDYWHSSGDIFYTLIMTLPHLSAGLQQQVKSYLDDEYNNYPPYMYNHTGWQGGKRENFITPPEVQAGMNNFGPQQTMNYNGAVWRINPNGFYALWKFAQQYGNAQQIFQVATNTTYFMNSFNNVPDNTLLLEKPHVHNAYIAGYIGYLELEKLAGNPESTNIRTELNRLLDLRSETFSKDNTISNVYCRNLAVSTNFINLVPELADYLYQNSLNKVQEAIDEYSWLAPYWFLARSETGFNEAVFDSAYNYQAMFQAKAYILKEPYEELVKYLDVPAFEKGDLFYIQNLVATIEAAETSPSTAPGCEADINTDGTVNLGDIVAVLSSWGQSGGAGDLNGDGTVNLGDVVYILNFWGQTC